MIRFQDFKQQDEFANRIQRIQQFLVEQTGLNSNYPFQLFAADQVVRQLQPRTSYDRELFTYVLTPNCLVWNDGYLIRQGAGQCSFAIGYL
ncbi:MAG: hypothetical protein ACKPKO_13485, partial [Candidatus Fonsibacter sp.]